MQSQRKKNNAKDKQETAKWIILFKEAIKSAENDPNKMTHNLYNSITNILSNQISESALLNAQIKKIVTVNRGELLTSNPHFRIYDDKEFMSHLEKMDDLVTRIQKADQALPTLLTEFHQMMLTAADEPLEKNLVEIARSYLQKVKHMEEEYKGIYEGFQKTVDKYNELVVDYPAHYHKEINIKANNALLANIRDHRRDLLSYHKQIFELTALSPKVLKQTNEWDLNWGKLITEKPEAIYDSLQFLTESYADIVLNNKFRLENLKKQTKEFNDTLQNEVGQHEFHYEMPRVFDERLLEIQELNAKYEENVLKYFEEINEHLETLRMDRMLEPDSPFDQKDLDIIFQKVKQLQITFNKYEKASVDLQSKLANGVQAYKKLSEDKQYQELYKILSTRFENQFNVSHQMGNFYRKNMNKQISTILNGLNPKLDIEQKPKSIIYAKKLSEQNQPEPSPSKPKPKPRI